MKSLVLRCLLSMVAVGLLAGAASADTLFMKALKQKYELRNLEVRQLPRAAAQIDGAVEDDRHAGGVVAAILEPSQPVDENGDDFLRSDISNDPAHMYSGCCVLGDWCWVLSVLGAPGAVLLVLGAPPNF